MIRVRDGDVETVLSIEEFELLARRGELSPHVMVSIPALTGEGYVEARALPMFASAYDPRRLLFRRHFHLGRLPLVTGAVALLCIAFWLFARDLGDGVATREVLLSLGAKSRARIVDEGETWRLLMASLLHKDGVHLGFNLFVLLAVGTVLEGVYRRGDYFLLLLCSGLACMATSTVASPPLTVGASGMVFGCLGCAMIFGLRFADVLPLRYRVYFGVVLVVYTAAAFWSGLLRSSTDNWGHAGGLAMGVVFGMILQPRLLRLKGVSEGPVINALPWCVSVVIVVVVTSIGPLLPRLFLGFASLPFPAFGLVMSHPTTWQRGPDPLGFVAVGNGTDALASLACSRVKPSTTLDDAARAFVDGELLGMSRAGHIADLEVDVTAAAVVAGVDAKDIGFTFIASDGPFEAHAYVFVRGEIDCVLVTAHRKDASEKARALLAQIVTRTEVTSTDDERRATLSTAQDERSTKAWLTRAKAHQVAGHVDDARTAFVTAARLANDERSFTHAVALSRAQFELYSGHDLEAAASAADAAIATAKGDEQAAEAMLAAIAVARARGLTNDACHAQDSGHRRWATDPRFPPVACAP